MRFIHTADIHLGSKMEARLPKEKAELRKIELRNSFSKLVSFAKREGIKVILLSGDVFDRDIPFKKDKDYFYSVIANNPEIDFLYLRGNHDSSTVYDGYECKNLKTFSDKWNCYEYEDVAFWGIEIDQTNFESLYSTIVLDASKKNVVMLHGQISDSIGNGLINLSKLRFKNIDYLALGHVHKHQKGELDERGLYAYPGCLESRGFDEIGSKGFIVYDTDKKDHLSFYSLATRTIFEENVNVTGAKSVYDIESLIRNSVPFLEKNLYRINLVGVLPYDLGGVETEIELDMGSECFYLSIKDKTRKPIDFMSFEKEKSLAGEFVRQVRGSKLAEEQKDAVIALGLNAINGKEFE